MNFIFISKNLGKWLQKGAEILPYCRRISSFFLSLRLQFFRFFVENRFSNSTKMLWRKVADPNSSPFKVKTRENGIFLSWNLKDLRKSWFSILWVSFSKRSTKRKKKEIISACQLFLALNKTKIDFLWWGLFLFFVLMRKINDSPFFIRIAKNQEISLFCEEKSCLFIFFFLKNDQEIFRTFLGRRKIGQVRLFFFLKKSLFLFFHLFKFEVNRYLFSILTKISGWRKDFKEENYFAVACLFKKKNSKILLKEI